jgi:hypothetical protein
MPLFDPSILSEGLLYTFFLPFLIVFVIVWGILTGLRVFNRRINLVLAFALTIAAWYGGAFKWLSTYVINLGATVAIAAFVILFIVGAAMWAFGRGKEIYYETAAPGKKLEKLYKEREKILEKMRNANEKERRALYHKLRDIEYQIDMERSEQIK